VLQAELLPEEWGGSTPFVCISAKKGEGIDELLETVALVAELEELQANPTRAAEGTVLESHLDKLVGPVASLLIQAGTLRVRCFSILPCAVRRYSGCSSHARVRSLIHRAFGLTTWRDCSLLCARCSCHVPVTGRREWTRSVQKGDIVQAGRAVGRVRACKGSHGEDVAEATPSTAVSVVGLDFVPAAGDLFRVHQNESSAREAAEVRSI
jgi:translation initiation factor IF-2